MRWCHWLAAVVSIGGYVHAVAAFGAPSAVPITVQGEATDDACRGDAEVSGLNPHGANRLVVRAGPGTGYARIDVIGPGTPLIVCEERGAWFGVIYGSPGLDCQLGAPTPEATVYLGPCRSGWVSALYVQRSAG